MCYGQLGELWEKSDEHIPGMKEMAKQMEFDSRGMESLGERWNLPWLAEEARSNQEKPSEGIAKASVATGSGFLGPLIGAWMGGGSAAPTYVDQVGNAYDGSMAGSSLGASGGLLSSTAAYEAAVPAMNQQQAAMLAAQTGDFGPYGLGKTMQAGSGAKGLTGFQRVASNTGGGLLSGGAGGGGGGNSKDIMNLMRAQQMMQPPQQQAPPPAPLPQGQMPELSTYQGYQPMSSMPAMPKDPRYMTEEEKRKYRLMMQRRAY
jgi:hypothetical protein